MTAALQQTIESLQWDSQGLVPTVVQDAMSKDVLMLAYMNRESLRLSVESGETWFWSRSRKQLWHKGAASGHIQKIKSISCDCDGDTLLVLVEQQGVACHTGKYSCFFNEVALAQEQGDSLIVVSNESAVSAASKGTTAVNHAASVTANEHRSPGQHRFEILSVLESVIAGRDAERPEGAYTTYLFEKGIDKILKKVGEETAEVIIAAKNKDNDELRYEASDLIFHLMVLLREAKLPLDELMQELDRRHVKKNAD